MMVADFVATSWINAVYATKDKQNETFKSIYKPTHVLTGCNGGTEGAERR